ncbi:glucosaminidase domain-containing protein [Parabacteroides goldsteinii]|uniref:glucosaminidase domain-containing protein n=1 Tax=Parabacteroides goldsteinii TaxID=328812 RepID=UPI0034E454BD
MDKQIFFKQFLPAAQAAGEHFKLNPDIILAQAAIESGWGESVLCRTFHNYFGLTGYGQPTLYWKGAKTLRIKDGGLSHLQFRISKFFLYKPFKRIFVRMLQVIKIFAFRIFTDTQIFNYCVFTSHIIFGNSAADRFANQKY